MNVALHPASLDILSLCTGGGGLDLGVELAIPGARTVCVVEREAFAVAHLVQAMEDGLMDPAPVWSDARTFDGRRWRGCVDGLIGGIPCQPHSVAGRRLGEDDERDLWSTARRIIVHARPWFVLIENVGGMLSSGGAARVWRDLRRFGFSVEIGLFTAAEIGAPHERERVFILAVADADGGPPWPGPRPTRHGEAECEPRNGDCDVADAAVKRCRKGQSESDVRGGRHAASDTDGEGSSIHTGKRPNHEQERAAARRDGGAMDDAQGRARRLYARPGQSGGGTSDVGGAVEDLADSVHRGRASRGASDAGLEGGGTFADQSISLFPPGPNERDRWAEILDRSAQLEPAVRRMADGLANRVDRLRLLGNGVVPLEAAYALRTLATRLAASGSGGAAELVRLMGAAE